MAAAAFAVLGVTFVLGALVGREWGRHTSAATVAEPAHRSATSGRRSGLTETSVERVRPPQEKLTFYQTLTAPLAAPASSKVSLPPKKEVPAVPRMGGSSTTERPARPSERTTETLLPPRVTATAAPEVDRSAASGEPRRERNPDMPSRAAEPRAPGEERREPPSEWTVQVGVFTTAQRAERIRKQLADAGFHPRVTPATGEDGQPRFRVRLGEFKTKDEALRVADRVRAERSLATFVTAK